MNTLLLTRSEVAALLEPVALLAALRDAFAAYSMHRTVDAMRIPVLLPPGSVPAGASGMLLAPGLVPGIPAYSVKVHAKFPGQDPAIRGVLVLHDLATGAPLALMESSHLTALRTGLAGALGADALARADARTVAIIGAGAQGRSQVAALRLVRPVETVRVLDPVPAAVEAFAADPACTGLAVQASTSLEAALDGADIVVTATWAREPFLFARHLRCQRRRENASARRSNNASSMNARRPPRGPTGVLVGWKHPPGARLALSVRCVEALGTGDGQSRPNPRGRSIA